MSVTNTDFAHRPSPSCARHAVSMPGRFNHLWMGLNYCKLSPVLLLMCHRRRRRRPLSPSAPAAVTVTCVACGQARLTPTHAHAQLLGYSVDEPLQEPFATKLNTQGPSGSRRDARCQSSDNSAVSHRQCLLPNPNTNTHDMCCWLAQSEQSVGSLCISIECGHNDNDDFRCQRRNRRHSD